MTRPRLPTTAITDDLTLRDFVDGLPDNFVECRIRHNWQAQRAVPVPSQGYLYTLEVCASCGTHKHEEMSLYRIGKLLARWYSDYPEGYRAPEQLAGANRDYLRYSRVIRRFPTDKLTRREQDEEVPRSFRTRQHIAEHRGETSD
jgi:hypothetical protein